MGTASTHLRVLIADDSAVVRVRLTALLEELAGVEIVAATASIKETRSAIKKCLPDLVILDLNMPDGNALELIEQMREAQPGAGVVVLTNFPYPEYEQRALDLGAKAFFDKSHEFMKVRAMVQQLALEAGKQPA